ncbi:MAG: hypothetical protein ACRDHP_21125, partial [Ktedonobacterales bacterium]
DWCIIAARPNQPAIRWGTMSHNFTISDNTYHTLNVLAAREGRSPETLFKSWLDELLRKAENQMDIERDADGNRITYASTADFLASLGADEERVTRMRTAEDRFERANVVERFVDTEYDDKEE